MTKTRSEERNSSNISTDECRGSFKKKQNKKHSPDIGIDRDLETIGMRIKAEAQHCPPPTTTLCTGRVFCCAFVQKKKRHNYPHCHFHVSKNKPSRQASPALGEQPTTTTTISTIIIRFQAARKPLKNHTSIHLTDRSFRRGPPEPEISLHYLHANPHSALKMRTGKEFQMEKNVLI